MDGYGYTPSQIGEMTLDQVLMLLCDRKLLRAGTNRAIPMDATQSMKLTNPDGTIKGRAADGTPIKARIGGTSVASRLIAQEQAKIVADRQQKRPPRLVRRRVH
jgi:hypothetical protein